MGQTRKAEVRGEKEERTERSSLKGTQRAQPSLPRVGFFANTESLRSFSYSLAISSGLVLWDPPELASCWLGVWWSGWEPSTSLFATASAFGALPLGSAHGVQDPAARSSSGVMVGPGMEVRAGPRWVLRVTSAQVQVLGQLGVTQIYE